MLSLQPFQNGGLLLLFAIKAVCRQLQMISLLKRPLLFVKLETKTFKVKLVKGMNQFNSLKTVAVLNNIRFFVFHKNGLFNLYDNWYLCLTEQLKIKSF